MEQNKRVLMKCGHISNATDKDGKPICIICYGIKDGADVVDTETMLKLSNRIARCSYCGHEMKSDLSLPFFEYKPNQEKDSYYCGCIGWD